MIVPKRSVLNFKDLNTAEIFDISLTLKYLTMTLERFHNGTSSTIHFQNYTRTDDKVNHMTVHLVVRKKGDLANNDDIYSILANYDKEFEVEYKTRIANGDAFSQTKVANLK